METTAEKLTYLNTTKQKIKDGLNDLGAGLTDNDTFRSYANALADIYDEYPKVTDEGTDLELTPTKKGKMKVDLKGNSSQFSTTGKNLFNGIYAENKGINSSGANYNKDGSNASTHQNVSANTTYTISGTTVIRVAEYDVNKSYLRRKDNVQTFTTGESTEFIRFEGQMNDWNNTQLELGSSATSYEPYTDGPAPNPDYPYMPSRVTGENSIAICNVNLFDKNNVTAVILNSDGTTSSSLSLSTTDFIEIDSSLTYYKTATGSQRIKLYDNNKTVISTSSIADIENFTIAKSFTIPYTNARYIRFTFSNENLNNIMLVKGSTAPSTYIEHEEQNYQVSLGNIELNSSPDGTIRDEIIGTPDNWVKREYIGKFVLDGTESGWSLRTNDGTNYCFSTSPISDYLFENDLSALSDYFHVSSTTGGFAGALNRGIGIWFYWAESSSDRRIYLVTNKSKTVSALKSWLGTNNVTLWYPLAQYTDIPITDITLISQLNDIYESTKSYNGTTNITSTYESGNEQIVIDASALERGISND